MTRRGLPRPEQRPAPKPTTWQFAVLRASRVLSGDAKVLLTVLWELDNGDGAFMNAGGLADQTGGHPSYVKALRAQLAAAGVVQQVAVAGSRCDFWFVLPPDCDSQPPRGVTLEQRRRWVREAADRFDARMRAREGGRSDPTPATEGRSSDRTRAEVLTRSLQVRSEVLRAEGRSSARPEHETAPLRRLSVTLKGSETGSVTLPRESDSDRSRARSETQQMATRGFAALTPEERASLSPETRAACEKLERRRGAG